MMWLDWIMSKTERRNRLSKPKKPKAIKTATIPTLDLGTERMVAPPAGQPKAKKIAEPKARSARVYRVNPKLAKEAEKLTAPQTTAIYKVLSHNRDGLTAEQIREKLVKLGFKSKNPPAVIGAALYDLRKGVCSAKAAGPGLVEIVGKPEAAPAEKKPKSTKPKTEATPAPTPAA